jgi:hypothetical protein
MRSENQRQSPFSTWLRTGRILVSEERPEFERKFNGWHDPANGRFTFVGTGRYFPSGRASISRRADQPFRGGGGGMGFVGGGGSGSGWPPPGPGLRALSSTRRAIPPARNSPSAMVAVATQAQVTRRRRAEPPWRRVLRNGYEFQIDESQRTRSVSGTLTLGIAEGRSRRAQARAGGPDRRPSDDGGHYIAHRFNGPSDAFNHFAQAANFNRGKYRLLEEEWARARRLGQRVVVTIVPAYDGLSQRPSTINVWYIRDGKRMSLRFPNEPGR